MLTNEERQEMRRRCNSATPGPWLASDGTELVHDKFHMAICRTNLPVVTVVACPIALKTMLDGPGSDRPNKEFIANSRADLPACLDALDEIESVIGGDPSVPLAERVRVAACGPRFSATCDTVQRSDAKPGDFPESGAAT